MRHFGVFVQRGGIGPLLGQGAAVVRRQAIDEVVLLLIQDGTQRFVRPVDDYLREAERVDSIKKELSVWAWPKPDEVEWFLETLAARFATRKPKSLFLNIELASWRTTRQRPLTERMEALVSGLRHIYNGEILLSSHGYPKRNLPIEPTLVLDGVSPQAYNSQRKYGKVFGLTYAQRCMTRWKKAGFDRAYLTIGLNDTSDENFGINLSEAIVASNDRIFLFSLSGLTVSKAASMIAVGDRL